MRIWLVLPAALFAVHTALADDGPKVTRDDLPGSHPKPALASESWFSSPITDHFYLRGTFYAPTISTELRLDSHTGTVGTPLSAEDDLGMSPRFDQGRMELMFRLEERGRLRVDYFQTLRSGDDVVTRSLNFGNEIFDANDRVDSELDFRMFGLTYTYSIFRSERFELGAGVGVHLLDADVRGQVPARQLSDEVSQAGAFPTLALDGTWAISRRFAWTARGQYLSAQVNRFDGSLGDYHTDIQYRWRQNLQVGVGYEAIRINVDITGGSAPGIFRFDIHGPEAFVRISF